LLITALLMAASMLAMKTSSKVSIQEARISTNDVLAHEVKHAAEAALNFGIAWYSANEPTWSASGALEVGSPTAAVPNLSASNGDTFAGTVLYSRDPAAREYIRVTATATAVSNASVTATVRQYVRTNSLLQNPDLDVPPLALEGCMSNITGNPDLIPKDAGEVSIATGQTVDCIDQGSLGYNGGVEAYGAFTGDIWDHTFPKSRAEMKAIADAEVAAGVADADRTVVWVTNSNPYHKSWGSASNPVILIFDAAANCPKINGNPTIYGMVFVDSDCTANGFGGFTSYGGIVVNGDVDGMNANVDMSHWTHAGAPVAPDHFKASVAPIVMGSWHDF
jgi:hypothetical protein